MILAGTLGLVVCAPAQPTTRSAPTIPIGIRKMALGYLESNYGPVTAIYAQGRRTWGQWARAEPSNVSGLGRTSNKKQPVYIFFVRGRFTKQFFKQIVPKEHRGQSDSVRYSAARIIVGPDGVPLLHELWSDPRPAPPGLVGPEFDD